MILSFASGENIGDSTKHFQSFSLINLGDPVISLKPLRKNIRGTSTLKDFDSTIGALIESDNELA